MSGEISRRDLLAPALVAAAGWMLARVPLLAQPGEAIDTGAIEATTAFDRALVLADAFVAGHSAGILLVSYTSDAGEAAVAAQIKAILVAVADARAQAAALAESERPYLRIRLTGDGYDPIIEAAGRYADTLGAVADQAALLPIREAVAAARRALVSAPAGIGIEAAILLPLAFAAEFGAAVRLGSTKADLRSLLADYERWAARMRGEANGSISQRRFGAGIEHDGELGVLATSHLGRRLGLSSFLLRGEQKEARIADPCVIFSRNIGWRPDRRAGVQMPGPGPLAVPSGNTPNILIGHSRIRVRDDSRFGVRLIRFDPGAGGNYALSNGFFLFPGVSGAYCYVADAQGEVSTAQAFAKANQMASMKEDKANRDKIILAVKAANACRIEIALSATALQIAGNIPGVLAFHERAL